MPVETIFLVDADTHVRRLVTAFLSDYEVRYFDNGAAALEAARTTPPAVVVTEVLLPGLDGLALCRQLKEEVAEVKVIVLSFVAANQRALTAGADAFLSKPIERRSFQELVVELVEEYRR